MFGLISLAFDSFCLAEIETPYDDLSHVIRFSRSDLLFIDLETLHTLLQSCPNETLVRWETLKFVNSPHTIYL